MTAPVPRIGSLCSGYGGLDMAVVKVLGGSMAWHCQYEPPDKNGREDRHQYAARILAHHWPDVPNLGDLTKVDWEQVERPDIVAAGFPCTDISYAGLGAGIKEGTRSGLWLTIARAIRTLRPRLVFLENVRAIVSRRPGLDVVLASLTDLGYDTEWVCVRASDVGAPHERWRWFGLARPAADAHSGEPQRWGIPGVLGGSPPAEPRQGHQRQRAGHAAGHRSPAPADPTDLGHEWGWGARLGRPGSSDGHLASADASCDGRGQGRAEPARLFGGPHAALGRAAALAHSTRSSDQDQPGHGGAAMFLPELGAGDRAGCGADAERDYRAGASASVVDWRQYGAAVHRWEHILGRPAPCPVDDRGRLSPGFVEWMMGLPEGHVTDVPAPAGMSAAGLRNARLKALGNGVVPQQAAYALRLLLDRMRSEMAA